MSNEALTIVVAAKDQASAALKRVGDTVRSEMAGVSTSAGKAGTALNKVGGHGVGAFGKMKASAAGFRTELGMGSIAIAGFGGAMVALGTKAIGSFMEAEDASAKLTASIHATGQAISSSRLLDLAKELQKTTTYSDEATTGMMSLLIAMGFNEDQVASLTPRIQNLSAAFGKDLDSTAKAVGRSILTQSAGALTRFGIVVDESVMKTGDLNAIMQELDKHSKGYAETVAKTGSGPMKVFKNQVDEIYEAVGKALVPGLQAVTPVLTSLATKFSEIATNPVATTLIAIGGGAVVATTAIAGLGVVIPPVVAGWHMLGAAYARVTGSATAATAAQLEAGAAATASGAMATAAAIEWAALNTTMTAGAGWGAAAAGGAGLAKAAAPAAAAAGTAAVAAGGRFATARGVVGAAARFGAKTVLPAYLAYEGLNWYYSGQEADANAEAARIEASGADVNDRTTAMWDRAKQRRAIETQSAADWLKGPATPNLPIAYLPGYGPGAAQTAPATGDLNSLRAVQTQPNQYQITLDLNQTPPPGPLEDSQDDYLDDASYAEEE